MAIFNSFLYVYQAGYSPGFCAFTIETDGDRDLDLRPQMAGHGDCWEPQKSWIFPWIFPLKIRVDFQELCKRKNQRVFFSFFWMNMAIFQSSIPMGKVADFFPLF